MPSPAATTAEGAIDPLARAEVVPAHPDAPGVPFPPVAEDAYDAELEAIAESRTAPLARIAFIARVFAVVAAAALAFALRYDLRYAFASHAPIDLGAAPSGQQLSSSSHQLVTMTGVPGGVGAVDYRRPMGDSLYRLAPLVDRGDVYVELKLPQGIDPTRYIPPTSLRGRLVPMDEAGARFSSARSMITDATGQPPPASTYILEEGAEPSWKSPGAVVAMLAIVLGLSQLVMLAMPKRSKPRALPAARA